MFEILHCSPIAQFALDLDHRITCWNKACEKLTGYTEQEMIGTHKHWQPFYPKEQYILADLMLQEDFEQFLRLYEKCTPALSSQVISAWEATAFFEHLGGQSRYLNFLAAPVINSQGKKVGVVETLYDITHLKMHELALKQKTLPFQQENESRQISPTNRHKLSAIIGRSNTMQRIYKLIVKASKSDDNVILYGESGTGKELVARSIHNLSKRAAKELVIVNCGAIPETLLESEFFGVRRGAYTGATCNRKGYLDIANGGTLFLDEVGDLSLAMQGKLLQVIENGEYTPLGSTRVHKTDIRLITATNKPLQSQDNDRGMREDFFYRIHVIPLHLPPLRERKEDLPLLIDTFLQQDKGNLTLADISGSVLKMLHHYHWPGNIRELKNVLTRFIALGKVEFSEHDNEYQFDPEKKDFSFQLEHCEKDVIIKALQYTHWSRQDAAVELGISRKTLFRKMKKLGIL
ncbi:MAG: sigma 54-interacting transcriptional regulator [Proteobacteria bacterium]|nr:sigma 54-interacting transcriptional regulator [Pseudomonadota bacterium]MBU1058217.1 sigma 54-interacting transcriptional regulator [Pseudomonadota bacterium]